MKLFIAKNSKNGNKYAFHVIKKHITKKPDSLIGFAVGKTTDGLYKLISKDAIKFPKKWSKLKIFQIDETLGLKSSSPISFNYEIKRELRGLIKIIKPDNLFLIDGSKNPKVTIKEGYKFIKNNGGVDLIILGLGPEYDPHIAYNTTGKSTLNSKMRVVDLHPEIIKNILKKIKIKKPKAIKGITLGIKDILSTKKVLLIAYGKEKSKSVRVALCGKVNMKKSSASALMTHRNLQVVLDKDASILVH